MTSTFRLLAAAMPEIAAVCEKINDPALRDRAFDVLANEARQGGAEVPYDTSNGAWSGSGKYAAGSAFVTGDPLNHGGVITTSGGYDPTSTRVDNGIRS